LTVRSLHVGLYVGVPAWNENWGNPQLALLFRNVGKIVLTGCIEAVYYNDVIIKDVKTIAA